MRKSDLKFAAEAELRPKHCKEIIDYFEEMSKTWNYVFRLVFHELNNNNGKLDELSWNKHLQSRLSMQKRSATSIIRSAKGRYNALKALKADYEKPQLEKRIVKFEEDIAALEEERCENIKNKKTRCLEHSNLNRKIAFKKMRLNKLKQSLANLNRQIETGHFKITFGTKKLANGDDKEKFLKARDRQMTFIGAAAEPQSNMQFQLYYDKNINQFYVRLRKDFSFDYKNSKDCHAIGKVHFSKRDTKKIKAILAGEIKSPLTFTIMRIGNKYKLKCVYTEPALYRKREGITSMIGIDFNAGFLAWTVMDKDGIKIWQKGIEKYRYGQGDATKTDLETIAKKFVDVAEIGNWGIVIEDLDFSGKKGKMVKAKSRKGKWYNAMLSSLAYSTYKEVFERNARQAGIYFNTVNPAYTSRNAKKYVCDQRKLNVHIGASYMIARRGMGLKDADLATV